MILVHAETGTPVVKGETVTDFRGDRAVLVGWEEPRHSGSTGRVYVENGAGRPASSYFPTVFGLEFKEEA